MDDDMNWIEHGYKGIISYPSDIMPPSLSQLSIETNQTYIAWQHIFDTLNLNNATVRRYYGKDWKMPRQCRLFPCGMIDKETNNRIFCHYPIWKRQYYQQPRCLDVNVSPTASDKCAYDARRGVICNKLGEIVILDLTDFHFPYTAPTLELPAEIGSLLKLKALWIGGNNFSKAIPTSVINLNELVNANFAYNNFEYPLDDDIKAMCIRKPMYGLIPSVNFPSLQTEATCTGFGGKYAISRFIPSAGCIICNKDPNLNTMVVISFLAFGFLSFLFMKWYKRSSERFPDKVKQTAASISILISQATLYRIILKNMRLRWPIEVVKTGEAATSLVSLNVINIFGVECFFLNSRNDPNFNYPLMVLIVWGGIGVLLFFAIYGKLLVMKMVPNTVLNKCCCKACGTNEKRSKQSDSIANVLGIGISLFGTCKYILIKSFYIYIYFIYSKYFFINIITPKTHNK